METFRIGAAIALLIVLAGCVSTRPPEMVHAERVRALAPAEAGVLAELAADIGPEGSSFRLLLESREALAARLALIDGARSSLDIQYYLWKNDAVGAVMLKRVVDAARRGVRVRILIDDFLFGGSDANVATLSAHPGIDVRFYNPWSTRGRAPVRTALEWLGTAELNNRMHNKLLAADNRFAIVGGRNIAAEYFGLNPAASFRDADVLLQGEAVGELSETFDDFWNDPWSFPADALTARRVEGGFDALADAVAEHAEAAGRYGVLREPVSDRALLQKMISEMQTGTVRAISDSPASREGSIPNQVFASLSDLVEGIESELTIVSAYFVPAGGLVDYLAGLVERGIRVRVVTNSLASNNHAIANSAWRKFRRPILEAGVELYEMRHDAAVKREVDIAPVDSRTLVLHSKLVLVDRRRVYIGALNMSPRSVLTNTENGVHIRDERLGEELAQAIDRDTLQENAWRVRLDENGRIRWESGIGSRTTQPARNLGQRIADFFFGLFPLADQI